ncbi:MFS transporter [Maricaulis sp.]|uniref:MFS transporter n=1 Tax=Maricaulis sp. TaxID=1486257 RepID=UPI003A9359A3
MTDIAAPIAAPPINYITKLLYGVGSMAYGVKDAAFKVFLLYFYNFVIGAPAGLVGAAILVVMIIDAISDPIVGQISDSLRTRWGRRHPLMYAAALPAAGSFLLLWFPPAGLEGVGLFWYIVVVASCVRAFITLYEIPSSALAPELSSDYDERTSIASYRFFFGYFGGIGLAFIALWFFLAATPEHPHGYTNPAGYEAFGWAGALIMIVSILVSTLGTHNRIKYLRHLPPPKVRNPFQTLMLMGRTFSHKGFLAVLAFGILKYTAIGMSSALILYFGTLLWGLGNQEMALLALDGFLGAFLALLVAPWISRRFGKRGAAFLLAVTGVLLAVSPYVLRLLGLFYANGDPMLLPALFVISSLYSSCAISSAILVHAMIGDVADESAIATGRRAEGLFYSANSFMQKCASGFGAMVASIMLAIVGMPANARTAGVDPDVITSLAELYIPTMALLFIGGALFLKFYRIDRSNHESNLAALEAQNAAPVDVEPVVK